MSSKRYKVKYDILPSSKKLAIGTILKRSGMYKKDDKMRVDLKAGKIKYNGRAFKRAGQTIKIDSNNIKIRCKGRGRVIVKLEEGEEKGLREGF